MTLKLLAVGLLLVSLAPPSRVERERDDAIARVQTLETALLEIRDQAKAQQRTPHRGFEAELVRFIDATMEPARR